MTASVVTLMQLRDEAGPGKSGSSFTFHYNPTTSKESLRAKYDQIAVAGGAITNPHFVQGPGVEHSFTLFLNDWGQDVDRQNQMNTEQSIAWLKERMRPGRNSMDPKKFEGEPPVLEWTSPIGVKRVVILSLDITRLVLQPDETNASGMSGTRVVRDNGVIVEATTGRITVRLPEGASNRKPSTRSKPLEAIRAEVGIVLQEVFDTEGSSQPTRLPSDVGAGRSTKLVSFGQFAGAVFNQNLKGR